MDRGDRGVGYLSPAVRATVFAIPGSQLLPSSELSLSVPKGKCGWFRYLRLIRRMSVFIDKRPALSKSLSATPVHSSPLSFPSPPAPSLSFLFSSR